MSLGVWHGTWQPSVKPPRAKHPGGRPGVGSAGWHRRRNRSGCPCRTRRGL